MSTPSTEAASGPTDFFGAPESLPLTAGVYTVKQVSSGLFLSAQPTPSRVGVREPTPGEVGVEPSKFHHWHFTPVAEVYTIRQKSSNRFLDAYETPDKDFRVVTRSKQGDDTQRWVPLAVGLSTESNFEILHLSSTWYLDAYESGNDNAVVLRAPQANASQRWQLDRSDSGRMLEQLSTHRFMDAHQGPELDFAVVTRDRQENDRQRWLFNLVGGVYTIRNVESDHVLDAHSSFHEDFGVVTRPPQSNNTQRWAVLPLGGLTFSLQQLSTSRFLDAHAGGNRDAVTRDPQDNDSQRWEIRTV